MSDDDDIPVLRDAIARRPSTPVTQEQLDDICDSVGTQTRELLDELLAEGLREAEESLRKSIGDRLNDELPALIDTVLRDKLAKDTA